MGRYASVIVKQAQAWIGCKEADGSHKKIIDIYNAQKPLPVGYIVKYNDAWCSTFVSAVAVKCGYTDIIPTECGCGRHIDLFKKKGIWVENDAYVPKAGDIIFYDWYDDGIGDNTDGASHVGIVEKVSGSTITVIEGNYSNSVARRTIQVNGKYIRGYGVPKYDAEPNTQTNNTQTNNTTTQSTSSYTVKKGDTLWEIAEKYLGDGAKYTEIKKLNGLTSDTIYAGQVLKLTATGQATARTYTVKKGDTLWDIATNYLGNGARYTEIKKLNGLTSDTIHAGQVLKLPAK